MKFRLTLPLKIFAALMMGAGCAVYAPFAAFALTWLAAVKLVLWSGFGFLCTFGLKDKLHPRLLRYTLALSFLLAVSFVLGAQLQVYNSLHFTLLQPLSLMGLWALCFLLLCHLFVNVPNWLKTKKPLPPLSNAMLLWVFFIGFCAIASLWMFSYYPVMTNYDIAEHLKQIASGQYETHHALVYSLLIEGLLHLANLFNFTTTWAFLMLGLLQMIIMGLSIGYGLTVLNTAGARRGAVIAAAVYFMVFPLFGYFAFSTTKDTLFSCFLLLTAIELYRLSCGHENLLRQSSIDFASLPGYRPRRRREFFGMARLVVFGVLMCQLRYNGTASLILFTAGTVLCTVGRLAKRVPLPLLLKRLIVLLPLILLLNTGTSALLMKATGATTPETVKRDVLSLPLQQLARVLQTAEDANDIARIEGLFGVDDIKERYRPDIADPVKAAFLYPDENTMSALRAWLKYSVKYPKAYLEAFLEITRGAWFIDDLSHTKIDYWLDYTGYLETVQKYREGAFSIAYQSILPALRTFLERTFMENRYLNIPLIRILFALAVQAWIAVIVLCYAAYHRRRHATNIALFALCVLLPLLLLPCMISRYFLPLFLLNPLCLLAVTVHKENNAA